MKLFPYHNYIFHLNYLKDVYLIEFLYNLIYYLLFQIKCEMFFFAMNYQIYLIVIQLENLLNHILSFYFLNYFLLYHK